MQITTIASVGLAPSSEIRLDKLSYFFNNLLITYTDELDQDRNDIFVLYMLLFIWKAIWNLRFSLRDAHDSPLK